MVTASSDGTVLIWPNSHRASAAYLKIDRIAIHRNGITNARPTILSPFDGCPVIIAMTPTMQPIGKQTHSAMSVPDK